MSCLSIYCELVLSTNPPPPRRHPYADVVVGLAWSNDPESYRGGSVAAGRASHAGQVKGDDPEKRDTLVLQVGGWSEAVTPPRKKCVC